MIILKTPVSDSDIENLTAGEIVSITGTIYTARDAAHKRLVELVEIKEPLPFDPKNAIIYYVGPTPAKPGQAIGSAGPTSSYRMDPYSVILMKQGLKVMIGKGPRSEEFKKAMIEEKGVYLSAVGGAAALISQSIKKCDLIAYPDLGAEAIYRLEVEDFRAIVTYDTKGNDLLEEGVRKYQKITF